MENPLAYFLTWTTHGSWLIGDNRNWVDKQGEFRRPDAEGITTYSRWLSVAIPPVVAGRKATQHSQSVRRPAKRYKNTLLDRKIIIDAKHFGKSCLLFCKNPGLPTMIGIWIELAPLPGCG